MRRLAGHVASLWWITLKEIDILEEPRAERRIILKCILKKQDGKTWTGLYLYQIRKEEGSSEHCNKLSDSTQCQEFHVLLIVHPGTTVGK